MDEISQGVRILIERCETNPDEMMEEYGKWSQLRNAVFDYMENRGSPDRHAWLRGLREDEIKLLYDAFGANYRRVFDEYVMKNVLVDEEEEETFKFKTTGRYSYGGWNDPRLLQNANNVSPGSWQNVAVQSSGTSIATSLKNALGIK
jgi:hypothetical protein